MREEQITVLLKRNSEDRCAICNKDLPKDPAKPETLLAVSEELITGVSESAVRICATHPRPKVR